MEYVTRKPDFEVKIKRPNFNASVYNAKEVAAFIARPGRSDDDLTSTALIAYNFSESIGSIETDFSLTFTLEADSNGRTWYDKLEIKDVVIISEFGQERFVGSISSKRYSARMTGGGPSRSISISGVSIGGLLSTFQLVIDQFLFSSNTLAESENTKLKAALTMAMDAGSPVSNILEEIYNSFFNLTLKTGSANPAGLGIKSVLDYYIDFTARLSHEVVMQYPIALSIYKPGVSNIWEIFQGIVVPPIFELYMLWNPDTKKYEGVFEQAPFESEAWRNLKVYEYPPVYLADHDVGVNDSEVYTYYLCTVAGSGYSDKKAQMLEQTGYDATSAKDEEKWKKYGYRPMIVEFKYFDTSQGKTYTTTAEKMLELSNMLKEWYEHNDEFISGSLTIMTIDESNTDLKNPRPGGKLRVLEAEFYIEEVSHSWAYGGSMKTKIDTSRGYVYNNDGTQKAPIKDVGAKLNQIRNKE